MNHTYEIEGADYDRIVSAICKAANKMRPSDERAVLGCLWHAGVHPSGFRPNWEREMLAQDGR